jgi:tetratricopeptide repeat protein 19
LSKAERLFHVALKTAQDLNEDDGITYIYDMLANVAFQQGDFKKAERLFTEVLNRAINKKKLSENHNAVIEISLKLAKSFEVIYTPMFLINIRV